MSNSCVVASALVAYRGESKVIGREYFLRQAATLVESAPARAAHCVRAGAYLGTRRIRPLAKFKLSHLQRSLSTPIKHCGGDSCLQVGIRARPPPNHPALCSQEAGGVWCAGSTPQTP